MSRLKAYHKFNIEVEFKTYADNGIILYNQQKNDGTGDFVSLAIVNGLVPFITIISKVCFLKATDATIPFFYIVLISKYVRDNYNILCIPRGTS